LIPCFLTAIAKKIESYAGLSSGCKCVPSGPFKQVQLCTLEKSRRPPEESNDPWDAQLPGFKVVISIRTFRTILPKLRYFILIVHFVTA